MEHTENNPARTTERVLFYLLLPVFVMAIWPYTVNPCEPPKLVVAAILALCCSILAFFVEGGKTGNAAGLRTLLALWLGWQVVCGLNSALPANSLWSLVPPAAWVLVAIAASRAFSDAIHAWRLAAAIVAAMCAASIYGFSQHLGWDPFPWASKTTVEYLGLPSTFGNPNFAGHALVPAILLALALASRSRYRIPALAAAALMTAHLWYTGMRGGPLALAAAALMFGAWWLSGRLLSGRRGRIRLTLLFTLLAGLALGGAGLAAYRATHGTWVPMLDSSLALRYSSYHGASRMMLEHPGTGIGPGNYERLVADWWCPFEQRWYAVRGLRNDHVHNEPLEAGAEAGIPGLLLHMLLLSWAVVVGLRLARDGASSESRRFGLVAALCAVAMGVDGLFGFNLHVPVSAGLFFILLGVLDGLSASKTAPTRGAMFVFAGRVGVLVLAVAVLAGALTRFRAETALLCDQGMQEQMGASPEAKDDFYVQNNSLLQTVLLDGRSFPNEPRFSKILGRACLVSGRFSAAEGAFRNALCLYPANPDLYADLARALHGQAAERAAQKDWSGAGFLLQRAEAAAERSRDLCPPFAAPHDALWRIADLRAELARQVGMDDKPQTAGVVVEANAALECGVADAAPVYRTLARLALREDRRKDAAGFIARALDQAPEASETWVLVDAFQQDIQNQRALMDGVSRAYAALKQLQSRHGAYLLAARWMIRANSNCPPLSLAVARDAVRTASNEPGAWGLLAETREGASDLSALLCAERAQLIAENPYALLPPVVNAVCAVPPPSPDALVQLAADLAQSAANLGGPDLVNRVKREYVWAVPVLKATAVKCAASPPVMSRVALACAGLFGAAQMWPEAEAACSEALQTADTDTRTAVLLLRSQIYERLSRTNEALADAREAVKNAPERLDVQWNLAQRLASAGLDQEAQFIYRMLVQQVPNNRPEFGRIAQEYRAVLQRLQVPVQGGTQ